MTESELFLDFLRRLRAGDQEAAAELVRRYGPIIRCQVRFRLTDPRLGRLYDSVDVCQSVLASFFVRASAGQYDLNDRKDLIRLLVRMARNKVTSKARRQQARPADRQRAAATALDAVGAAEPDPHRVAASRELLHEVRRRLDGEERQVADLRALGMPWPEIASQLGGTPEARRKQLARALDRVARELGLAEDGGQCR